MVCAKQKLNSAITYASHVCHLKMRGFSYQPYFPSVGGTGVEIWGNPAVFNVSAIDADFAAAKAV